MSNNKLIDQVFQDLTSRLEAAWDPSFMGAASVALHEPFLGNLEKDYVSQALASGYISSVGPFVEDFAQSLQDFTGIENAVPMVNGTSALQLALVVSGVKQGDEVAVPALSFIATANAVTFAGAHPVFLDINNMETDSALGLSASSLLELLSGYERTPAGPISRLTGRRLGCLVPMHTLGRLCDLNQISEICKEWHLPIVEDAAEAVGSFNQGLHAGSEHTAILSFNGNKTITTGGGGALLTRSSEIADLARKLSTTAKIPHPWRFSHSDAGWNFRMPAINAAVGLAQVKKLPEILKRKQELTDAYCNSFETSEFFRFYRTPNGQVSNNWLNVLVLNDTARELLPELLDRCVSAGLQCRPMWDLLNLQKPYASSFSTSIANSIEARRSLLCIPSSPSLARSL